jgi:hypothetical protein
MTASRADASGSIYYARTRSRSCQLRPSDIILRWLRNHHNYRPNSQKLPGHTRLPLSHLLQVFNHFPPKIADFCGPKKSCDSWTPARITSRANSFRASGKKVRWLVQIFRIKRNGNEVSKKIVLSSQGDIGKYQMIRWS